MTASDSSAADGLPAPERAGTERSVHERAGTERAGTERAGLERSVVEALRADGGWRPGPAWGTPPGLPELPADDGTGMVSIGVTLDLPEPYCSQLRRMRLELGDERARTVPAHITLIPPMEIPASAWPLVREHIRAVANATSPFTLQLRGTGTFMPTSPVVFIAVARGISECQRLSESLRAGVLNQQLAFPYHPHVTIAQGLSEEVLEAAYSDAADYDVSFMAHGFGVYFHTATEEWQLFDKVPFGP